MSGVVGAGIVGAGIACAPALEGRIAGDAGACADAGVDVLVDGLAAGASGLDGCRLDAHPAAHPAVTLPTDTTAMSIHGVSLASMRSTLRREPRSLKPCIARGGHLDDARGRS